MPVVCGCRMVSIDATLPLTLSTRSMPLNSNEIDIVRSSQRRYPTSLGPYAKADCSRHTDTRTAQRSPARYPSPSSNPEDSEDVADVNKQLSDHKLRNYMPYMPSASLRGPLDRPPNLSKTRGLPGEASRLFHPPMMSICWLETSFTSRFSRRHNEDSWTQHPLPWLSLLLYTPCPPSNISNRHGKYPWYVSSPPNARAEFWPRRHTDRCACQHNSGTRIVPYLPTDNGEESIIQALRPTPSHGFCLPTIALIPNC
ncbi:hypothetical protein L226DRAFT_76826 [Lentinus tigrinus ALCF2SS1-7]|uniref:uncharacterized protein n=1 Tax=Lentinus tigrinus ALCF2SS1-7 TaxID=1328758 RepID=UPI001165D471|nr:hypothetical protein L226DRAFT_76826 [Lentinus tigrinus ALCF2SS1-7]